MRALGQALLLHLALARPITEGPHLYRPGNLAEGATYLHGQQGAESQGQGTYGGEQESKEDVGRDKESYEWMLEDRVTHGQGSQGQGAETRGQQVYLAQPGQDLEDRVMEQLHREAVSRTWPFKKVKVDDSGFEDIRLVEAAAEKEAEKLAEAEAEANINNEQSNSGLLPDFLRGLFGPRKRENKRKKKEQGKLKTVKGKNKDNKPEQPEQGGKKRGKGSKVPEQGGPGGGETDKTHKSNNVVKQKPSPTEKTPNPAADILPDFILDLLGWTSKSSDLQVESRRRPHSSKPSVEHDHEHVEEQQHVEEHDQSHMHDHDYEEEHLYYNTHTHNHKHDHYHEHEEMLAHDAEHKHLHQHKHQHSVHGYAESHEEAPVTGYDNNVMEYIKQRRVKTRKANLQK